MNRYLTDTALTLLVYAIYLVAIVVMYDPQSFLGDAPPLWPIWMWLGSLCMTILWYVLGEWVIRPNAPGISWIGTWICLFVFVLVLAGIVTWLEGMDTYLWVHVLGGCGSFYFASVLASPLFAKYRIWPASLIRKW